MQLMLLYNFSTDENMQAIERGGKYVSIPIPSDRVPGRNGLFSLSENAQAKPTPQCAA